MREHNREVFALIGKIHRSHTLAEVYPTCLLFMVDCLRLVEHLLPTVAQHALAVAEKFCNGTASARQLLEQKMACWTYLDERELSVAFESRRARLVRATLCALYPDAPEDGDVYTLLEWFMEMLDPKGRMEHRTLALLKLRFDSPDACLQ